MIRLVIILVALAVGFGVGVYWGVKHPIAAQKLASVEERQFVEKQKQLLERLRRKLDQLASAQGPGTTAPASTGNTAGRSGFVSAPPTRAGRVDPELEDLKQESERQLQEADKLLRGGGR